MTEQDSKSLSKQRYTEFAQGYVNSQTHAKGYDLDRLVALANPQSNWIALDIATGGGHTALRFAPHVKEMVASDLTPKMLDAAKNHILDSGAQNVRFEIADAEALPFEDGMFDLVTCRIAPHHFPDAVLFVREVARVLKPSGVFLLQDHVLPNNERAARAVDAFEKHRDPSHNRAFTESEWRSMAETARLSVLHTEHITKRHHFLTWAQRQGNTPQTIAELLQMYQDAPADAQAWMQVEQWGTDDATFVNHHLIMMVQKPS